jgi:hypothetical protein
LLVEVEEELFTGALALSACAPDGLLLVVAAAALPVLVEEAPIEPDAAPELA